jgi:hypothetical protein
MKAVSTLGTAYPAEIMEVLRDQTLARLNSNYEFDSLASDKKESIVKEQTMKERTMYNGLKFLTKEHVLLHSNNQYSLSEKVKSDSRNFPYLLGDSIISALMSLHRPTVYSLEHNIRQLVESLGFYFFWCFICGARPIDNDFLSAASKDDLVVNWIKNSFDPLNMYEYFLAAVQNQEFDDVNVNKEMAKYSKLLAKYQKGLISDVKVSPPSTDYFYINNLKSRLHKHEPKNQKYSKYELPNDKLDKIQDTLRIIYPDYYKALMQSSIPLPFNPKQQLTRE